MLSLRFFIVMSLSGVALWGLFSLLENLRKPELLRSAKAIVIKGCDPIETDEAARLCPQLFCQKSLLDTRAFPLKSHFEVTVDLAAASQRLIGGVVRDNAATQVGRFACLLESDKGPIARAVDQAELDALAHQPDKWSLEPIAR
ncbi:MAG: hypothetical protein ACREV5_21560 [Steroidobacter sp.]